MTNYDSHKHRRHSMRLPGYDYTTPGAYFVTLVTWQRELFFDDLLLRRVAESVWQNLPIHFAHVELDESVVMPNHMHGIIWIMADDHRRGDAFPQGSRTIVTAATADAPIDIDSWGNASPLRPGPASGSVGAIIGNFRSVTSRRINHIRNTPGATIWQRNFHDHIIRNERELNAIRQYVRDNPANWAEDLENPTRST